MQRARSTCRSRTLRRGRRFRRAARKTTDRPPRGRSGRARGRSCASRCSTESRISSFMPEPSQRRRDLRRARIEQPGGCKVGIGDAEHRRCLAIVDGEGHIRSVRQRRRRGRIDQRGRQPGWYRAARRAAPARAAPAAAPMCRGGAGRSRPPLPSRSRRSAPHTSRPRGLPHGHDAEVVRDEHRRRAELLLHVAQQV